MAAPTPERAPWWADRALPLAILVDLYLRALALARWPRTPCLRDECTYLALARQLAAGEGLGPAERGWLWAPGYPALLALHERLFGQATDLRLTQIALSALTLTLAWRLAFDLGGRPAARRAGWLYALSPTLGFFSLSLWSESVYVALLLGALVALGWARQGGALRALAPGALVGACVLFRGVATYMLPIFALGLLWERPLRRAWPGAVALALGAALVVAPWSVHASARWEGRVISDRTLGQMMWLGNNTFPPLTFDHGNGALTPARYAAMTRGGRPHCAFTGDPTTWDDCEVAQGLARVRAHPGEFLARVPLRLAQLFNPNSFLTRHLRQDGWRELPGVAREGLVLATLVWSGLAMVGGTLGLAARGRGWLALVVTGILLYHVAAIAALAGLSRYRVPLDGLLLLYAALALADPRATARALLDSPPRLAAGGVALAVIVPLALHFLPLAWS